MTHPIGTGTKNITYNGPTDEWELLHRMAGDMGVKFGELLKRLVLAGADATDPATAARIRSARQKYYGAVLVGLFLGLLFTQQGHEPRRVSRPRPAIRREVVA